MQEDFETGKELDAKIVHMLERRPEIAVSENFAASVVRSLPVKAPARQKMRPVFGRVAGYLALAATMIVLTLLARWHPEAIEAGRGFLFGVELLLVVQLLAVGFWLGMRRSDL